MSEYQRVSVAMCTYNGARFLPEQLASILSQTSPPDEMVICDDGSTDETAAIVTQFAETASFPVRFVVNEERLRFAGNFAKCISLCDGDLIVMTDQDDVWVNTRVQDTRDAYFANPKLTFTYSDAPLIDDAGQLIGETIYSRFPRHRRDRERFEMGTDLLPAIIRWGFIYGCTMTIRASLRETVLPVPEGWSHDEWLSLSLSSLGDSLKLRPQTNYRQHGVNSVGVGDWSFAGKIRMVKSRNAKAYDTELAQVMQGHQAAKRNASLERCLAPTIARKVAFLSKRNAARRAGLKGVRGILEAVASGEYSHFSAGPKSVLKDIATLSGVI